jgi:hypothetical protein
MELKRRLDREIVEKFVFSMVNSDSIYLRIYVEMFENSVFLITNIDLLYVESISLYCSEVTPVKLHVSKFNELEKIVKKSLVSSIVEIVKLVT